MDGGTDLQTIVEWLVSAGEVVGVLIVLSILILLVVLVGEPPYRRPDDRGDTRGPPPFDHL